MSESVSARRITINKGRSVGMTTTLDPSLISYYMDTKPSDIKYTFHDDKLMEKWMKKLTPLLSDILND